MIDQISTDQLREAISSAGAVGIVVSDNPDLDTMAGALALYLSFSQAGKPVTIACKTDTIVALSSLVGIDKVGKTLSSTGGKDLTIALPYHQGAIEKISYNIEGDKINLVIKAGGGGLQFDKSEIQYQQSGGSVDLLLSVGVTDGSKLNEFISQDENGKGTVVVNIDNKSTNQQFGTIVLTYPEASSISELVGSILLKLGVSLDIDTAQNVLSGIDFATNNFQDTKTSPLAFEMASMALRLGAQRPQVLLKQAVVPAKSFDTFEDLPQDDDFLSPFPQEHAPAAQNVVQKPKMQPKRIVKTPQEAGGNPPADWLTPKIYKGSTSI